MALNRSKHRKQGLIARNVAKVAVVGAMIGAPLAIAAAPAEAATTNVNWDAIAQCESSGNWGIASGNGFYGGLQFTLSTWKAYGGTGMPQDASRDEQIAVAQRVLAGQGIGAWPNCGPRGLEGGPVTEQAAKKAPAKTSAPQLQAKKVTPTPVQQVANSTGNYVVVSGDTLSGIAQKLGVQGGWTALWNNNKSAIPNPDLIFPGEKIATS